MEEQTDPEPEAKAESQPRRVLGRDRIVIHDNVDDPLPELEDWADSPIFPVDESEPTA